jgi:hypothetical protein
MSIESNPFKPNPELRQFIEHLERAEEAYYKFYDCVGELESENREAIQLLLSGIERMLIGENTKIAYPEQYDPTPDDSARTYFKQAFDRLGFELKEKE